MNDSDVFNTMLESTSPDKTIVNLFGPKPTGPTSEDLHNTLMAAGFTPGLGNIADAADALLYLVEGEFGNAAISAAAMIPIAGQMVSAKKALKAAKKAGEKTIKIYRGAPRVYAIKGKKHYESIVDNGNHISPKQPHISEGGSQPTKKSGIWATDDLKEAQEYRDHYMGDGIVLEYEVPESWYNKHQANWFDEGWEGFGSVGWFEEGIPVDFFKKVKK